MHTLKYHRQFHCKFGIARQGQMPDGSFACFICNKCFKSKKILGRHLIRECSVEKRYVCQMCGFVCFWNTDYKRHLSKKHQGMDLLEEVMEIDNGENRPGISEMGDMVKGDGGEDNDEETPLIPENSKSCLEEDLYISDDEDMEAQLYPDNFVNTGNAIKECDLSVIPSAENFKDLTNIDDDDGLSKAETESVQVDCETMDTQTRSEIKKSINIRKPKSSKKEKKSKQEKAVKKEKKVKRKREDKENNNCKKIKTESKRNDQPEESLSKNGLPSGKVEENMKNDMRLTEEEQMNEDAKAVTHLLESSLYVLNLSLDQVLEDLPKMSREDFERMKMENPEITSFES